MVAGRFMDRILYSTEMSKSGQSFIAFCPELVVTAFGDNPGDARQALQDEISAYLEDCEELGILEEVLEEAGFYDNGEAWVSGKVDPAREPKIIALGPSAEGGPDEG